MCVSCILALVMEHANHIISASYYIIIFDLSGSIAFFLRCFINDSTLEGAGELDNNIEHKTCVLFSLQLLSATFLILKRIWLVVIINL